MLSAVILDEYGTVGNQPDGALFYAHCLKGTKSILPRFFMPATSNLRTFHVVP